VSTTRFWHLNIPIWKMGNNFWCFCPFYTQNRANLCLLNVEQDLLIRILIFSISGNFNSKIWNNRVQSRSPTCTGAYMAWETNLRGVFRVYLKGRHGPNPTSPFSRKKIWPRIETSTATTSQKKMKMWDLVNFPMFPSGIFTRTPKTHCGRLGRGTTFVLSTL